MKPSLIRIRVAVAGLALCGLALAACGPRTPNLAAETPFVPTQAAATATVPLPTSTTVPEAYPAATEIVPALAATATPGSYPATEAATEDPYETGAATATTAPPTETVPPQPTATIEPLFITYRDFEIVPASSTAKVGQQVVFLIQSASGAFHQPYAGAAAPFIFEAPPNMGNGVSWPITFNRAQTLTILCGYHGNMTGTLTIEP